MAATPKVLHVVENLDRGAVENWLVRMLRHAVSSGANPDWTFYCALGAPGRLDEEVRRLGARIVMSPVPIGRTTRFVHALRDELRKGQYDVLHCHHDLVSSVYLAAALGIPIGKKLVHVHNADESLPTPNPLKRSVLRPLMRSAAIAMADCIVGISNHTLDTFLAGRGRREGRDIVHYYGIDPAPFRDAPSDRPALRRRLGVAADSRILLFAGRLAPEKNPLFALDVLAEMRRRDPGVVGVFVGSGALEKVVCERAAELGLGAAFHPLGWRDDVAEIMCSSDWFILPRVEHPLEGLGVAVVEAQIAGLRMLLSTGVPEDPLLPGAVFRRMALREGAKGWADAALGLLRQPVSRADALDALAKSPFAMDTAFAQLMSIHR